MPTSVAAIMCKDKLIHQICIPRLLPMVLGSINFKTLTHERLLVDYPGQNNHSVFNNNGAESLLFSESSATMYFLVF